MVSSIFIFLQIAACISPLVAGRTAFSQEEVASANEYVDEVLNNLRNEAWIKPYIDPINLPSISESNFHGWNGVLRGLYSVHRDGDCTLSFDGKIVGLAGTIAVKDLTINMNYKAWAGFFWVHGDLQAVAEKIAVSLKLSLVGKTVRLDSFKVAHFGNYYINWINGLSPILNWLLKIIANNLAQKQRGMLISLLEREVADNFRQALSLVDLPLSAFTRHQ